MCIVSVSMQLQGGILSCRLRVVSCQLRVASCQLILSVVSWFLSAAILQATNILFIAGLIVMYYDINA